MPTEVMTVSEVAEYLRLNPQTVYRKAKAGELPALRIGRVIRFRRSELDHWLKSFSSNSISSQKVAPLPADMRDFPGRKPRGNRGTFLDKNKKVVAQV